MRRFFDGLVYSEMISVEGLLRKNPQTMVYLERNEKDSPLVYQLYGFRPESFAEAVKIADDCDAEAYDINMGCPVKKVINAGSGSTLLKNLPVVRDITRAIRAATDKPISVKIRLGWDHNSYVYKEILNICEGEGIDALIVHGRTKTDMFGKYVWHDRIAELPSIAKIPVIGNGSVYCHQSYERMKETGVDGIMVGRGMMKAPWIFAAIREKIDPELYLTSEQKLSLILDLYDAEKDFRSRGIPGLWHHIPLVQKYAVWFSKGIRGSAEFRTEIYKDCDDRRVYDLIVDFYSRAEMEEGFEGTLDFDEACEA